MYNAHTGTDGNIMPYHIFQSLFPRTLKEQLEKTKK